MQAAKGQQKPLLATPAESAVYGIPFAPAPGPPGVGGPVLQYMPPVEGIPPFAMPMDPSIMMSLEGMGHYQGGLFIPHIPPEEQMQRMMMAPQGDSPQHVRPSVQQPKQRSRAIPIVPPKATSEVCIIYTGNPYCLHVLVVCVCVCACVGGWVGGCMCACVRVCTCMDNANACACMLCVCISYPTTCLPQLSLTLRVMYL